MFGREGIAASNVLAMLVLALFASAPLLVSVQAQDVQEPEGYRGDPYRGPVPKTLKGGKVLSTDQTFELWQTNQVAFVDVLPRAPKPKNLPEGTIWREKPRYAIPGSIWLPNVGYEKLDDATAAYFKAGLEKATGGDMSHPVVFYCLDECWMSWNAAKRALEYGYSDVAWYPEGTDGWGFEDHPLEEIKGEPFEQDREK